MNVSLGFVYCVFMGCKCKHKNQDSYTPIPFMCMREEREFEFQTKNEIVSVFDIPIIDFVCGKSYYFYGKIILGTGVGYSEYNGWLDYTIGNL